MVSFPYCSRTTPIRIPKDMGIVWETYHKGVPLFIGGPWKYPLKRSPHPRYSALRITGPSNVATPQKSNMKTLNGQPLGSLEKPSCPSHGKATRKKKTPTDFKHLHGCFQCLPREKNATDISVQEIRTSGNGPRKNLIRYSARSQLTEQGPLGFGPLSNCFDGIWASMWKFSISPGFC